MMLANTSDLFFDMVEVRSGSQITLLTLSRLRSHTLLNYYLPFFLWHSFPTLVIDYLIRQSGIKGCIGCNFFM